MNTIYMYTKAFLLYVSEMLGKEKQKKRGEEIGKQLKCNWSTEYEIEKVKQT